MASNGVSTAYEVLDTLSSSGDFNASVVRSRESGEQFLLKR